MDLGNLPLDLSDPITLALAIGAALALLIVILLMLALRGVAVSYTHLTLPTSDLV